MTQLKCKMCGGTLNIEQNKTVVECEFCGTKQTVPNIDNEKKINLHERANMLRLSCSFAKASMTYENIIEEFPNDAEAHWGLVLCRYGIEYIDDPKTKKKIPTCHRTQYKSIFDDIDYKAAIENSDVLSRKIYQEEAEMINKIQKNILAISQKESPYDIFICYKENDNKGKRTRDSVIAQEIYETLTKKQYKVFFSKITLESKLGSQYEPYIFSALNTAKVMLVIATNPEYFNAPWVKNEWGRYIELLEDNKKYIIPCYRDMDIYELPDELVSFQSLDMNKLGFIQDLVRGIDKIFDRKTIENSQVYNQPIYQNVINVSAVIKRCEILIADKNYDKAEQLIDEVLNNDPTNAKAYILLLLMELGIAKEEDLLNYSAPLDSYGNFQKALQFANEDYREVLNNYNNTVKNRIHLDNLESIYKNGVIAKENKLYNEAISIFESINEFKDSENQINLCKIAINENIYNEAQNFIERQYYAAAISKLETIIDYKDSKELIYDCKYNIKEISYKLAKKMINDKQYSAAIDELNKILDYKDSADLIEVCKTMIDNEKMQRYQMAQNCISSRKYEEAIKIFSSLGTYKDSTDQIKIIGELVKKDTVYNNAVSMAKSQNVNSIIKAIKKLETLGDYRDSIQLIEKYKEMITAINEGKMIKKDKVKRFFKIFIPSFAVIIILLIVMFTLIIPSAKYNKAKKYLENANYNEAAQILKNLKYKDSENQRQLVNAYMACEFGDYEKVIEIVCSVKGKVNITYDANGGTSKYSSETITSMRPIENSVEKPGYMFFGWEITSYDIKNESNDYLFNITLQAQWDSITYSIKYILNGGKVNTSLITSYNADTDFTLPMPSKKGYAFEGWHNSLTNEISKSTKISKDMQGDVVFTAIFNAIYYKVTFYPNGGTYSFTSRTFRYDDNYVLTAPNRPYYDFIGWYYGDQKISLNGIYKFDCNISLEARWQPTQYRITYNLNGGTNNNSNPTYYTCESDVTIAPPTKEGYTFMGWSDNNSNQIYNVYNLKNGSPQDITLTAYWKANNYTIKFDANGGYCSTTYKTLTFGYSCTLPIPTRSYYEFVGWYYNGVKLDETKYNIIGNVTVKAKWEPKTYTITYNLNGGTNSTFNPSSYTCETYKVLNNPFKAGYTFIGWSDGISCSENYVLYDSTPSNLTLTAQWRANTYIISFVTNGGNYISSMTVTYDKYYTLPTPVKDGYEFECWTLTNSSSGTIIKSGTWKKTSNITIYAQWKPLKTIDDFSDEILSVMNKYSSSTGVTTKAKYFAGTSDENLKRAFSDKSVLIEYKWFFEYGLEVVDEAAATKPSIKTIVLSGTNAGYAYDNIKKLLNDLIKEDTTAILTSNVDGRCFLKELIHEIINKGEESAALPNYPQFIIDYSKQAKQDDFLDIYAKNCESR